MFLPKASSLDESDLSGNESLDNDMEAMKQEMKIVVNRAKFKAKQEMSFISRQIESTLSNQNSILTISNRDGLYPTLTNDYTIHEEDKQTLEMFPRITRGRS